VAKREWGLGAQGKAIYTRLRHLNKKHNRVGMRKSLTQGEELGGKAVILSNVAKLPLELNPGEDGREKIRGGKTGPVLTETQGEKKQALEEGKKRGERRKSMMRKLRPIP